MTTTGKYVYNYWTHATRVKLFSDVIFIQKIITGNIIFVLGKLHYGEKQFTRIRFDPIIYGKILLGNKQKMAGRRQLKKYIGSILRLFQIPVWTLFLVRLSGLLQQRSR